MELLGRVLAFQVSAYRYLRHLENSGGDESGYGRAGRLIGLKIINDRDARFAAP